MTKFGAQIRLEVWTAGLIALGGIDSSRLGSSSIVTIGLAIFAFACLVEQILVQSPVWQQLSNPPLRWFGLWLAWAAGSAVFAASGPEALLWTSLFAVLAGSAMTIYHANGELGLARTLLGSFVLFVVISIAVRAVDSSVSLGSPGDRPSLLALEANQLVRMAAAAVLASLYLAVSGVRSKSPVRTICGAAGAVGSLALVVAGQSRTGTAALLAAVVVFVVALAPPPKQRLLAAAGALALASGLMVGALAAGGLSPLLGKFEAVASRDDASSLDQSREIQSLNGRLEIWPEIIDQAGEQPVTGYGIGSDRDLVTTLYADGRIGWLAQHTHNLFLHVLLTTGVIGLVLMSVALISTTARAFAANTPLGPALLVLVLIDGISEAVIRVPSFGWFGLVGAAAVAAGGVRTAQLMAENTVATSSSISSTADS